MSNGSLAGFLFGDSTINLYSKIQIALEIARGLLYLHQGCSTQIIHFDIKPQNILLDGSFTAKNFRLWISQAVKDRAESNDDWNQVEQKVMLLLSGLELCPSPSSGCLQLWHFVLRTYLQKKKL